MTRTTPSGTPLSQNFHATPTGGRLTTTYDLVHGPPYTADLQWNQILRPGALRPPKAETLPLGHHDPTLLSQIHEARLVIKGKSGICC
ncbi:hypothetical protein AVEN_82915-1 [Araneus ventricosus]|uniref:Uncharacterized protein n=1 Tax=Araneus ventricosus TaxID=182803 RepID=A0A4Y2V622_ARAVE|nr:hypothetical protein AVEN_82915-1 [Araneus ventricosus]